MYQRVDDVKMIIKGFPIETKMPTSSLTVILKRGFFSTACFSVGKSLFCNIGRDFVFHLEPFKTGLL